MNELWSPVTGFVGRYEVSDAGRVRSLKRHEPCGTYERKYAGRMLKPAIRGGYLTVTLYGDGNRRQVDVHRLVAEAFVTGHVDGLLVRHLNGNPQDNAARNLAWGTSAENNRDTVAHGRHHMANREACDHGHAFTAVNTRLVGGQRVCRACDRRRHARTVTP